MSEKTGKVDRRIFLENVGLTPAVIKTLESGEGSMLENEIEIDPLETNQSAVKGIADGPSSPLFTTMALEGNSTLSASDLASISEGLQKNLSYAPAGNCVCWGIPFAIRKIVFVRDQAYELHWREISTACLVFLHTTDMAYPEKDSSGFYPAGRGPALLRQPVADYIFLYGDGSEERLSIRRQHQIGMAMRPWGANCFESVAHRKPYPVRTLTEQPRNDLPWGNSQFRLRQPDSLPWTNWVWYWRNPFPEKPIRGIRIEPAGAGLILSAITAGRVVSNPLRWETRRKAILRLPDGFVFEPNLSDHGLCRHLQLDLGQLISVQPLPMYPNDSWENTYSNKPPELDRQRLLVEYTAHAEACFHFEGGAVVPVSSVEQGRRESLTPVTSSHQRVRLRVCEKNSGKPVAVKLHIHGEAGEYLAPLDRHRYPNTFWYEDWSVDYINPQGHNCTYIPGEATIDLPLGNVFVEISKGFEIAPIRRVVRIDAETRNLQFDIEKKLPWREKGWVSADTHVHFLSPHSAWLEGAGEGVNVVNLLASQWGELMTNVGDFDGFTTLGARESGGDGEYLVRVGTENRQHVLGHISLLGYKGPIITPMTTGGPDESALGDPVEVLLTEWARQCKKQGGLVVLPHFPQPRGEHAAAILCGDIDAIETTSWQNLYRGIDPYSLSDWYRYLNCGYFVAAVGGTDKMSATTAVGAVRTYARIPDDQPFTYETWMQAIRSGNTFATYGPLLEFSVEGKPAGSRLRLKPGGGKIAVDWRLASVTIPMSRVDLIVNGEVRESKTINAWEDAGHWVVSVPRSSWMALLVRGHYPDRSEMIAAHSSPVMMEVEGTPFFAAADALTILEQIEGSIAYLDTLAIRPEVEAFKRMRMVLTGAHRILHNRLHQQGVMHDHTPLTDHPEHHRSQPDHK